MTMPISTALYESIRLYITLCALDAVVFQMQVGCNMSNNNNDNTNAASTIGTAPHMSLASNIECSARQKSTRMMHIEEQVGQLD